MRRYLVFILLAVATCFAFGCSPNIKLTGKVVYSDDKSPVPTGMVCFSNGTFMARGNLDKNGVFNAMSVNEGDGIPPGTYQVYIMNAIGAGDFAPNNAVRSPDKPDVEAAPMRQMVSLIDLKYTRPDTSGLTVNVDGKTRSYNIEVERYSANAGK